MGIDHTGDHRFPVRLCLTILLALAFLAGGASTLMAQIAPDRPDDLDAKSFRHADLSFEDIFLVPGAVADKALASELDARLAELGVVRQTARVDARSGRFSTLLPTVALIPGDGFGNELTWSDLGIAPKSLSGLEQAAWDALYAYLEANQAALGVDPSELTESPVLTSHDGGDMIQIHAPRQIDGLDVRGSYVSAVIKKGNLILLGAHKWSDRGTRSNRPQISADEARAIAAGYLSPFEVTREWGKPEKLYLTLQNGNSPGHSNGYRYVPVWAVKVNVAGDRGSWEVLVDAHKGEVLANEDRNAYADVKGGVYPVTNDGIVPDGVEQAGWPMPFQDVSTSGGTLTTDTGGNVAATGSMTATLFGPYVNINDNCGAESLTQSNGIDWGTSAGTDCDTPGFGGPGNTHASRTGFYELNKVIEMARGQLPSNGWLQNRLTSNMNINSTCNAFWNGTVNFYRSGGGCANTGEIAGVFDHEWGHGMDANDATPGIASPSGEGIADVYTALRLNTSCIGRNFRLGTNCTGNGDPCLSCDGVRDIDYLKRASGQPHDYSWSNANCGGSVHCVGGVYSEAVWSLWKRKLQSPPYNYSDHTAHEIVTRLTFIGAGATGTWFSGGPPNGGCGGSSGYMNYLAADDDDGNLNNGTPHMTAIYEAFNDQEIACQTPAVQDSGCAGTPTVAPVVSTNPGNQQIDLSWGAVAGAVEYEVFRTEGVFACDFGKVKLGSTTGTSWNDTGLQNGRDYSYVVIPKGPADSCFGPASACATDAGVGQPDFTVSCVPAAHSIEQGTSAQSTCTVISSFGYTGNVALSCSGNPPGITCSFAPTSVSPPANGSANSTLTIDVDLTQAVANYGFDVVGDDGSTTRTSGMSVTVTPQGQNGPQTAVYNATLGAPECATAGSSCDSTTLVDSRDTLSPPEPNQPNTLDGCADGTSGSYHSDESNDRIVVRTLDGFDFAEGATVEVEATVWAWSTGSSDTLDIYYAADATNPTWVYVTSIVPPSGGAHALTAQYTLPTGTLQAVRAAFRYTGSASPCTSGAYNDRDDLVFAVNAPSQCTVDADCDDGAFCNGAETCNAGTCQAGTAVDCDDGVSCTNDSCNETTDTCDNTPADSLCDNGLFCDGTETCDAVLGCQAGTAVDCDDGVSCTNDSCNEGSDSCDNVPADSLCDNGIFCDGSETCDAVLGCQAGPPPTCDDGVSCTVDSCDAGTDACDNSPNDGLCDNGLFCDGSEICDAVNDCQAGSDPCPGQSCDESADVCVSCTIDADCDDGLFCNGAETCLGGSCQAGSDPCAPLACDENADVCVGGSNPVVWMSFRSGTVVPGVGTVADEDIVSFDEVTAQWALEFDGSDVGLGGLEIDGLAILPGGDLLLSFTVAGTVGGLSVDDSDVVRFTPTSMGSTTAGSFSLYFDGSDVGLTRNGEDVDSIALMADGRMIISTTGNMNANGASGADEDLFVFTGTLGSSTSGSFAQYFDGSDVGLSDSGGEDVDAAARTDAGSLLFSTVGAFSVTGVSGEDEDVPEFTGTFGSTTSGNFSMRLDLSTLGIDPSEDVGSLHIVE